MRYWIFSCKKITGLISESMDRELSLFQRAGISFHLMMCHLCRRYQQQLLFIQSLLQRKRETSDLSKKSLPSDARKRIEKKLNEEVKK